VLLLLHCILLEEQPPELVVVISCRVVFHAGAMDDSNTIIVKTLVYNFIRPHSVGVSVSVSSIGWTIPVILYACLVVVLMQLFSRLHIGRCRMKGAGLGMEVVGRQNLLAFRDVLKGVGGYQACQIEPTAMSTRMAFDNPLDGDIEVGAVAGTESLFVAIKLLNFFIQLNVDDCCCFLIAVDEQ
jgi:hypothetical protein